MANKRKYDHLVGGLPKSFGTEASFQQKVDEFKRELRAVPELINSAAISKEYLNIRDEKEVLARQTSDVNVRLEAVQQLMAEVFEVEGITGLRTDTGQLISIWEEPDAQVTDKDLFRRWCDDDPDLRLKMQLWPSTTKALVKDRLLAGEEAPPGVTAVAITKVRMS